MKQLITRWGRDFDKEHVLTEYPRPQLIRNSYYNLNGEWEYSIGKTRKITEYTGKIIVPFSPETYLSGVERILGPDEYLHYRKVFQLPENFQKDRVLLHFGAVDQECEVWLNGYQLGIHKGGYLPFTFDITRELEEEENVLTLCVVDQTELASHARGKQKLVKKGKLGSLFYTPNSGIWKTVWMESVYQTYITDVKITPCFDDSEVAFCILTNREAKDAKITILKDGKEMQSKKVMTNQKVTLPLKSFAAWSPNNPNLYDVKIQCGKDEVMSYFGMRKLSIERDRNGILRFFLNDEPFFFNGLLDQGYWPESLLTPPSDEALRCDILKLKELGYNTIRKHIKIESERFYYHCDKIGMMVWQDMPNGGGTYHMLLVSYLPNICNWFARGMKDNCYALLKREDEAGRKQYYDDLKGMVELFYNHPSIAVWIPFNEGWGQFDAARATECIQKIDKTRWVNEACGWFDQKGGDIYSIHNYIFKLKVKPQKDRVVALTEYGGYSYPVKNHLSCVKEFGYQAYHSSEELTANYKRLWIEEIYPNLRKGLSSAIYTQTTDIEEEINGLMTYDREVSKMQESVIRELNEELYRMFKELTM